MDEWQERVEVIRAIPRFDEDDVEPIWGHSKHFESLVQPNRKTGSFYRWTDNQIVVIIPVIVKLFYSS